MRAIERYRRFIGVRLDVEIHETLENLTISQDEMLREIELERPGVMTLVKSEREMLEGSR